ncbi:MAG: DUF4129 domain-containing protein [Acidobacteriota bacterium]|nr:DUF4129 domain-containing protein [Acidobacteriota bacterium]
MVKRQLPKRSKCYAFLARRFLHTVSFLILATPAAQAIPISQYHSEIQRAVTALDTLAQRDETEDAATYETRSNETVNVVRNLLPQAESVEWNGSSINVDNSWLHQELDKYAPVKHEGRTELLNRIKERLKAIDDRLNDVESTGTSHIGNKADESRKLAEILQRPEYARKIKQESALARLLNQFVKWFQSLFPKPKAVSPGTAGLFTTIAQVFVILLAIAVLAFVVKLFLPRLLRPRRSKKKAKAGARIVLGEKLEPDQSATDLLVEAEALARRGELRAAIRKAYIALLVELGERKILSLAQHKTNRDYLRAVRDVEPLYGNVKKLTDSFERHWYGFANATETDWRAFRAAYERALSR